MKKEHSVRNNCLVCFVTYYDITTENLLSLTITKQWRIDCEGKALLPPYRICLCYILGILREGICDQVKLVIAR